MQVFYSPGLWNGSRASLNSGPPAGLWTCPLKGRDAVKHTLRQEADLWKVRVGAHGWHVVLLFSSMVFGEKNSNNLGSSFVSKMSWITLWAKSLTSKRTWCQVILAGHKPQLLISTLRSMFKWLALPWHKKTPSIRHGQIRVPGGSKFNCFTFHRSLTKLKNWRCNTWTPFWVLNSEAKTVHIHTFTWLSLEVVAWTQQSERSTIPIGCSYIWLFRVKLDHCATVPWKTVFYFRKLNFAGAGFLCTFLDESINSFPLKDTLQSGSEWCRQFRCAFPPPQRHGVRVQQHQQWGSSCSLFLSA